ncbi:unnamed protein product [Parnassius apollo]|uniref:(apollo) hypothetical protein n=1 Tax=Parnassius apollo TaxID=110799 RepID=A0A8S3WKW3_PARAO|nr:unnamed protein product [Parnassius apollo]
MFCLHFRAHQGVSASVVVARPLLLIASSSSAAPSPLADQGVSASAVVPRPLSLIASSSSAAPSPLADQAASVLGIVLRPALTPSPAISYVVPSPAVEPSSEESKNEEMAVPFLPCTIRSLLETPMYEVEELTAEPITQSISESAAEPEARVPAPMATDQP